MTTTTTTITTTTETTSTTTITATTTTTAATGTTRTTTATKTTTTNTRTQLKIQLHIWGFYRPLLSNRLATSHPVAPASCISTAAFSQSRVLGSLPRVSFPFSPVSPETQFSITCLCTQTSALTQDVSDSICVGFVLFAC